MTDRPILKIQSLIERDDMRAWLYRGKGDALTVCFSGIGAEDKTSPGLEFPRFATRQGKSHALFIADPGRTWLNGAHLLEKIVKLIETVMERLGATRVFTMGHSMGGFMAAVLAKHVKAKVALCFSPQASVHPEEAGDDPRWMLHRGKIEEFRVRHVDDHLSDEAKYFVIFGTHPRERPQVRGFAPKDNRHLFLMPRTVHNTSQRIKGAGVMDQLIHFALQGRVPMVRRVLRLALDAKQITEPLDYQRRGMPSDFVGSAT